MTWLQIEMISYSRSLISSSLRKSTKRCIVSYVRSVSDFESEVRKSSMPVIVDFKADWCGPCKLLTPRLLETEKKFADRIKIAILDIDNPDNEKLVTEFKINAVPTLITFDNGKEVSRLTGLQQEDVIEDIVSKLL